MGSDRQQNAGDTPTFQPSRQDTVGEDAPATHWTDPKKPSGKRHARENDASPGFAESAGGVGLPAGCYLAPRRRVSISMTMKPAARTAAFKFSVSAKSAAALRNSKKVLIRLFDLAGGCAAALTFDGD
jgi:hypothetical protein